MVNQKILYVTSELYPYQEDSNMANMVNAMSLKMYNEGNDVRVFMPRFGTINERKFQLHEVIRLSGMNIIINDLDQPLLIKVASLPNERMQVYFIDNEEYFKRKKLYFDKEGAAYDDNDERAVFFARGVIETIKKLNWVPDIMHVNGWMASFIPLYLKTYYKDDKYFDDTKIVVSVYNEKDAKFCNIAQVLKFDGVENQKMIKQPNFRTIVGESLKFADLVLKGDESLESDLESAYQDAKVCKKDFINPAKINEVY